MTQGRDAYKSGREGGRGEMEGQGNDAGEECL